MPPAGTAAAPAVPKGGPSEPLVGVGRLEGGQIRQDGPLEAAWLGPAPLDQVPLEDIGAEATDALRRRAAAPVVFDLPRRLALTGKATTLVGGPGGPAALDARELGRVPARALRVGLEGVPPDFPTEPYLPPDYPNSTTLSCDVISPTLGASAECGRAKYGMAIGRLRVALRRWSLAALVARCYAR